MEPITSFVSGPEVKPAMKGMREAMAKRYKARGYEVDICKFEFKGSYEV